MTSSPGNGASDVHRTTARQACTVLYNALPPLDAPWMESALRRITGQGSVEWARGNSGGVPLVAGTAQFGRHHLVMIALDAPVKSDVLALTVGVSPMPEDVRAQMMGHRAAVRVLYMGNDADPVEQLKAMYVVAGVLLSLRGVGIINERAALALPTELAATYLADIWSDSPPISLWVGVVTFNLDEDQGDHADEETPRGRYLMRTYGMDQMDLPELGMYVNDRSTADSVYHTLLNICLYIVEGGQKLQIGPGHRADFGGRTYLFTDAPEEGDEFGSATKLLMLLEV